VKHAKDGLEIATDRLMANPALAAKLVADASAPAGV
jgi:hypothetical protein